MMSQTFIHNVVMVNRSAGEYHTNTHIFGQIRSSISAFLSFIRFRICAFAVALSISGYFLFNSPGQSIALLAISSFLLCGATYAYNNTTDVREDLINRKKINPVVASGYGVHIVAGMFALGIAVSALMSGLSLQLAVIFTVLGIVYSLFRVKKFPLVKNLYTGFGITILFLMGVRSFTADALWCYLLLSVFFFTASIIADIRDYTGDKETGVKTLAVLLGHTQTRIFTASALLLVSAAIIMTARMLLPLGVSSLVMTILIVKTKAETVHTIAGSSLFLLALWSYILTFQA